MKDDVYPVRSFDSSCRFEFVSEGPKGRILKEVRYDDINDDLYMLGFGDFVDGVSHDHIVTNNKDTKKVLLTVSSTLYEFFRKHPKAEVYISGRTGSRMRLFRIAIATYLVDHQKTFHLFGQKGIQRYAFEKDQAYETLVIRTKSILSL